MECEVTIMQQNPRPQKSVFHIKSFQLVVFLLGVVAFISSSLIPIYFANPVPNEPNTPANQSLANEPHAPTNDTLAQDDQRSESIKQLSSALTSTTPIKVIYELPQEEPVVYLTIDDGWFPNEEVLKLMQQYHLPITTFLIEQAAQKQPDFWYRFVKAGGHIEDHTIDHPYLTHLSFDEDKKQISQPIDYFLKYGPAFDELRPPYGDFNSQVGQAAWDSGIKYIVMWDAEMENSTLTFRKGSGLKAGDIILLHWVPGLDQEMIKLLNIIKKQNLGIADLTQALNGEPLTICWLKVPVPTSKPTKPVNTAPTGSTGASSTAGTPSASGTPSVAGTPSASGTPSAAGTPSTSGTPSAAGTPSASGTPSAAGTPSASGTPSAAGTPSASGTSAAAGTHP